MIRGKILQGQGKVREFYFRIFRWEATPAGPLFWLNWNLEVLVIQEEGSFAGIGRRFTEALAARRGPTTNSAQI